MRTFLFTVAASLGVVSVMGPARPAAAVASVDGYVWANQPTAASYVATTGYEHNSAGGDIVITRSGTGRYQVRFEGMGTSGGVAHATAYGLTTGFCTITSWRASGGNELVGVRCYDEDGVSADLPFTAAFTNRQTGGTFAYFWSNDPAPAGSYTPTASYRYDSTGSVPTVERVAIGQYFVYAGAVDSVYPDYDSGKFQVTAYGSAAVHCQQGTVNDELPAPITVRCYTAGGDPVDSRFTFSYAHTVNMLGTAPPNATAWIRYTTTQQNPAYHWLVSAWTSPGGEPTVNHSGTGSFVVTFPSFSGSHGYATAAAYTNGPQRCHVVAWLRFGADESVIVSCHDDGTGMPADSDFSVAFLPEPQGPVLVAPLSISSSAPGGA